MKTFTSKNQKIGEIGEDVACKYLANKGFLVVERNYTKKCGEIDIVAKKGKSIHFFEVKTVSWETLFRAEENLHPAKLGRIARTVEVYLLENPVPAETSWQIDALIVRLDLRNGRAKAKIVEHIL